MLRAYERALTERDKTASPAYVGEYIRHFLEGEPSPGIDAEYALVRTLLPGITLEEVSALARQTHTERAQVLLVSAPEKHGLPAPDGAALLALSRSVRQVELTAYDDQVSDAALVPTPPSPRAIVSQRTDPRLGTIEWTLASGARVIVRPTDFRADEVLFTAYSGGYHCRGRGLPEQRPGCLAGGAGGLGTFDAVALDKLSGEREPRHIYGHAGLSGSSPATSGPVQLIYLTFTAPRVGTCLPGIRVCRA
jgi:zinc protease